MTENEIANKVIGFAIDVHKALGPGLLESAYKECLYYKIGKAGLLVEKEKPMPLIFEDVKAELIALLLKVKQKNEAIHKFAGYLQNKIADALKKHYQSLKTESPVNLKNIRTSLEDVLVDFNKPLTDWAKAFKNVKMVYDLNKLNSLNGDILCSLKVNVEMQNLQVGFDETIKSGDGENAKRRIRLA